MRHHFDSAGWLGGLALLCGLPGAAIAGDAQSLTIRIEDCQWLTAHVPDESVAYQAGVDVNGQPVVPADVDQQSLVIDQDEIAVDPRLPLGTRYVIPPDLLPDLFQAEVALGDIELREGVAYLGDRPLADRIRHALAKACADLLRADQP
jgi:hypothetical protein